MASTKNTGFSYSEHDRLIDIEELLKSSEHDNVFDFMKGFPQHDFDQFNLSRSYDAERSFKLWWHTRTPDEKIDILNNNLNTLKNLDGYTYSAIITVLSDELQQFANSKDCKKPFETHLNNLLGARNNTSSADNYGYLIVLTYLLIFERDFKDSNNDKVLLAKNQQRLLGAIKQHPSYGNELIFWGCVGLAVFSLVVLITSVTLMCIQTPALLTATIDKAPLLLPALTFGSFPTLLAAPVAANAFRRQGLASEVAKLIDTSTKAGFEYSKLTQDYIYDSNNSEARHTKEQPKSKYDEVRERIKELLIAADKGELPPRHTDPSGSSPLNTGQAQHRPTQNHYYQPQGSSHPGGSGNYYEYFGQQQPYYPQTAGSY